MEVVEETVGVGVGERGVEMAVGEVDEETMMEVDVVELTGVEVGPRAVVDGEVESSFPPGTLADVLVEPSTAPTPAEEVLAKELEVAEFLMYMTRYPPLPQYSALFPGHTSFVQGVVGMVFEAPVFNVLPYQHSLAYSSPA